MVNGGYERHNGVHDRREIASLEFGTGERDTWASREEDRSTIFAIGTRARWIAAGETHREREREKERETEREKSYTCTHAGDTAYRSASSVLELFSYFHVKWLFGSGHRGLLPRAWTGPVIKFISYRCWSVAVRRQSTACLLPTSPDFSSTWLWRIIRREGFIFTGSEELCAKYF